jgi:hypothetical protein
MVRLPGAGRRCIAKPGTSTYVYQPTPFSHLFHAPTPTILAEGFMNMLGSRVPRATRSGGSPPHTGSIVVIGTCRPRWPTREYRFGRWLRTKRYHVVLIGARSGVPEVSWVHAMDHFAPSRC